MVKALAISLRSRNSTLAPSGWLMHAWSHTDTFAVKEMHLCYAKDYLIVVTRDSPAEVVEVSSPELETVLSSG